MKNGAPANLVRAFFIPLTLIDNLRLTAVGHISIFDGPAKIRRFKHAREATTLETYQPLMKKVLSLLIVAALFSCNESGQTVGEKPLQKVEKNGDELVIPFEKYQLDNGLTVIIHEDHSDPIVHVDVTYHVGSAREEPGRSGFAHFFEHMMFQGSDNVADEEHFKIVTEAGGDMNGTTNQDRTNYFETMPANQLETALWLEADRMGFLLDSVTQKKFEVQRGTVKNERGQRYDNRPYGLVNEKVAQALYPQDHPYAQPTIGYLEDLDAVDVSALKEFFLRWYGPNNASIVIAGDVNPAETLEKVKKYFGSIPRGPEVEDQPKTTEVLEEDRYISYEDNIRFPLIQFNYPTVHNFHEDEAPLDILSNILGGSKNSIFYKNFEKAQVAVNAQVFHPCSELTGRFALTVLPYPGRTLAEMEEMIRASLKEFEERGVNEDDLTRFKSSFEARMINGLETVSGKAAQLSQYQYMRNDPDFVAKDLKRYMDVTSEDIMRVYEKYIKDKHAVIISAYPKGQPELKAAEDNYVWVRDTTLQPNMAQYEGLTYNKPTPEQDGFDRTKRPEVGPSPSITVPDYWKEEFDNGLTMIGVKNDEIPKVNIRISLLTGHRFEDPAKAGIANLFSSMMGETTENYTSEELSSELEKLGSTISIRCSYEEITVNMSSLTKNVDATAALLEEVMMKPKFTTDDFNRLKNQQMEGIANQVTDAGTLASNAFREVLYGKDHIMAIPVIGRTETLEPVTLTDVQEFYENRFVPNIGQMVIVGNMERDEILPKLGFLQNWAKKEVTYPEEPAVPEAADAKIYIVDKEGAAQSEIRIGYMSMPRDFTGEYYKANLMNFPIGGNFNSRINLNLREDKAWTYGTGTRFQGTRFAGPFALGGGFKIGATDSALVEIITELKDYTENGATEDELAFTKLAIGQQDALKYEAGYQKAGFLADILRYDLDADFTDKQSEILANITLDEINELAKKHIDISKMAIVICGDKDVIMDGLSRLDYEIEVMNLQAVAAEN